VPFLLRSLAVARLDARIWRREAPVALLLLVMPLGLMAFLKPSFALAAQGTGSAPGMTAGAGAEVVVPAMIVMFGFFGVSGVGFAVFREHGWNTWERLRASWASPGEIMLGKVAVPFVTSMLNVFLLFALAHLLLGLRVRGSYAALALVSLGLVCCLLAMGLAIVAMCTTVQQVNVLGYLAGLVFGGLGGTLTAIELLPGWARAVAPFTPGYWAMDGFRGVLLSGKGVLDVLPAVGLLSLFTVGFVVVAAARFRMSETKTAWA
jgi:ABC-2 type transport system permease protein